MRHRFYAKVDALSHQGFGVVRDGTQRYFARGVWPGDEAWFEVEDEGDNYGFALVVELVVFSKDRREVACRHFGLGLSDCYGCPWIIADYASQLKQKQLFLSYQLERLGVEVGHLLEPKPASHEFAYRNRAQFKTDGELLGYSNKFATGVAPIDKCLVLNQDMRERFQTLKSKLPNADWRPASGFVWNYLDIDDENLESLEDLELNRRRPFKQANNEQNEYMKAWLIKILEKEDTTCPAIELFAGAGNFTEVLTSFFDEVLAVEVDKKALAKQVNSSKLRTLCLDLFKLPPKDLMASFPKEAKFIFANPPRLGLSKSLRAVAGHKNCNRFIYVSCNPVSFAHDAKKLSKSGFKLQQIQPVDQLPQTPHLELLAEFIR